MINGTVTTGRPSVIIFGDGEGQAVSKAVWSALAGMDVRLIRAYSSPLDDGILEQAHMVIVNLLNTENNSILKHMQGRACNIIGIIQASDPAWQAELLGMGCDIILTQDYLDHPALRQILLANIEKGRERINIRARAEVARLLDAAIDHSPESFILFDANRELSYVSSHFRKAYPNNGHKLLGADT